MIDKEINKKDVIQYFNQKASDWDKHLRKNEEVINTILTNCGIKEGKKVLDVGCGTGVLFDFYRQRKAIVTGIDISDKMIEKAKENYPLANFIVADAEEFNTKKRFDAIVVYNAFPHFSHPQQLIENLSGLLKKGGYLTIAHGLSREQINQIHHDGAMHVSNGLMDLNELEEIVQKYLKIEYKISNDCMYQIVGRKVC